MCEHREAMRRKDLITLEVIEGDNKGLETKFSHTIRAC
jgi:hypothetical protein